MTKTEGKKQLSAVVVGGGLSGLAAGYLLREEAAAAGLPLAVTVLEAEEKAGGKIGTLAEEGFLCEIGPNGFLDNKPYTLQLCAKMKIEERLLRSNDDARKRYIFSDGALRRLPESPMAFLQSDLISWPGKIRIAGEYLVPPKRGGGDETLAEFVRRRLGQEALEKLIDPMASGIFAGDPENMSLSACFAKVEALEQRFGGLLRGMMAMKKEAAASGRKGPDSAGPGGVLMSFRKGLGEFIGLLQERLEGGVRTGVTVTGLARQDEGGRPSWRLSCRRGKEADSLRADAVVLAIPAFDAADLLRDLDAGISSTMGTIPYAAMAVVHTGYRAGSVPRPLDGFGYLIPHREGRRILGTLWASSIFAGRSPEGHVLLTNMMGGAKDPEIRFRSEEELVAVTREELAHTMGIRAEPVFVRVLRWEKAIPQYTFGHLDRVVSIEKRLSDHPGLFLIGNAFRGIGVNDCVQSGMKVSAAVIGHLGSARNS